MGGVSGSAERSSQAVVAGGNPAAAEERVPRPRLVQEALLGAIHRGDFKPGEALPSERELVETFGVSRVSVREAMRWLEALGYIDVHQGRGSFVSRGPTDGYIGPFSRWLRIHKEEVLDLLRVRGALDELAAEGAAEWAEGRSLDAIRTAHAAFAAAAETPDLTLDRLVELDIEFHQAIAEASGSQLLIHLLQDLNRHLGRSRKITLAPEGRPRRSAREHEEIVEAILSRRPWQAKEAVARHIAAVRRAVSDFEAMRSAVGE